MEDEDSIRVVLSGEEMVLDKVEDDDGIFDDVGAFIKLSRDNETVKKIVLYLFTYPPTLFTPSGMASGRALPKASEIIRRSIR
jgi:hypothetical protein